MGVPLGVFFFLFIWVLQRSTRGDPVLCILDAYLEYFFLRVSASSSPHPKTAEASSIDFSENRVLENSS